MKKNICQKPKSRMDCFPISSKNPTLPVNKRENGRSITFYDFHCQLAVLSLLRRYWLPKITWQLTNSITAINWNVAPPKSEIVSYKLNWRRKKKKTWLRSRLNLHHQVNTGHFENGANRTATLSLFSERQLPPVECIHVFKNMS